jgi:DNA-binding CsgD family transcriptional regulator
MANQTTPDIQTAHDAVARRAWSEAFDAFEAVDRDAPLAPADLEQFAFVAQLVAADERGFALLERAHPAYRDRGDVRGEARTAFWLAFGYMQRGEMAQAGGWLARAQRILESAALDCPEQGYVRVPAGLGMLEGGAFAEALQEFQQILDIGERFNDRDLITLGRLGSGQALVDAGKVEQGTASLDEAMVGVTTGEVSPLIAGIVYCATIEICQGIFDLERAREWTEALDRWCESQPDLVPFRGQCLVYRAELMQLNGDWQDAAIEVERARHLLADPPQPAIAIAYYREAELHRVRGNHEEAERSFRAATERGHRPHPGLALLRLAQGRADEALGAITAALDQTAGQPARAALLAALAEIAAAASRPERATEAATELAALAAEIGSPFLDATAAHATGLAALARGAPAEALPPLEEALAIWLRLPAPYEAARTRVLIAEASTELGDPTRAEDERALARDTFRSLGAADDLRALDPAGNEAAPAGLTPRELKVLSLVATGMTNRAIAANLTISEKTVARHLSNIFGKLGVSSRSAATAYAYQHDLV